MAIAGIKKDKEKILWEFLMKASPFMSANDKDGIGYAAIGPKGIWGERWRYPGMAWLKESRKPFTRRDAELQSKFGGNLEADIQYSAFGTGGAGQGNTAVIYHSRFATCDKTMDNVHPFVRDNVAMIHNGVIRNAEELQMLKSTCDSETILNEYCDFDVTNDPDKIQEMAKKLRGYYGCAFLTMDKNNKSYLDIFRHSAWIYASYVEQLGTVVYCTSDDIIKNACKEMKFNYGHMFKLKEDMFIRIDAVTGVPILNRKFDASPDYYNSYNKSGTGGSANAGKTMKTGSEENGLSDKEKDILGFEEKKSTQLVIVPSPSQDSTQEKIEETRSQNNPSSNLSKNVSDDRDTYADIMAMGGDL